MSDSKAAGPKKFGTFLGVFLPSILTILGLIMYLRFGWVLGNLGLGLTIVVVLLSSSITFIASLSASALATNIKVGVGGLYYLISRSFGLETGGAIGIAFYISRTLSITFYSFGLAESILIFWPAAAWGPMPGYVIPAFAAVVIISITFLAGRSAELMLRLQVPILLLVALSILALIVGALLGDLRAPEWSPTYRTAPGGFWMVFAVFFPGVTGFLAGTALSGDLKDPGYSIPRGSFSSVLAGAAVYLIIPVVLSVSALVSYDQLADPDFGLDSWTQVAFMGGLFVYPAAWGAILASAIGSVMSGPRLLQSLSMDGLAPKFLSRLSKSGQPTVATWVTGGIALAATALGELNTVAKFVTVLFLTLYVVINLVAATEKLVAEPSYRPRINVPWYVSLVGAIGALYVMYLISPVALLLAVGLQLTFYIYFKKKALEQQWGDVNAGFWMKVARFALLRMDQKQISARNWRPLMLVFVRDVQERIELVKLAAAFGQNRGVLTISRLVFTRDREAVARTRDLEEEMRRELKPHGLEAFCEVNVVESLNAGILHIAKGHGLAGLKTNTIVFGWSGMQSTKENQLKIIRDLGVAGKNILLVNFTDHEAWKEPRHERIDIWWGGRQNNGDLMLILAYMLQLTQEWEGAQIHIRAVVQTIEERSLLHRGIEASVSRARIPARVHVLLKNDERFPLILQRESAGADIVFLGLKTTWEGEEAGHVAKIDEMATVAKTVVFVQNNSVKDSMPILLRV